MTSSGVVPQDGAIVFRREGAGARVLLVRARRDPTIWIFPKGHIEANETAADAAVREAREEAGVAGELGASVGVLEFDNGREFVRVEYFLVRWTHDVPADEHREKRWCTFDEAAALINFEDSRRLLEAAYLRVMD